MPDFDPRTTLARDDLAAEALEGVVRAERFARPQVFQCVHASAAVRREAGVQAEQVDQILFGELFETLERREGWVWGQARRDGYVGWVPEAALAQPVLPATHRIRSLRTYAFPEPDIKSGPPLLLTMNALVTVEGMDGRFARVARGGYVPQAHLGDLLDFETDAAGVAELYLGAPYQWGGRESVGLDCSGLVQQALLACGKGCPRDADMQEAELGEPIAGDARARGDLVFWKDHVAMLLDAERLIHANGFHMAVAVESLESAIARNGAPTGFRRP
ncbi:MAG: C40 family peptidase [Caulobacteraceae bacterium]|nr:C40 family peptidase [Caulobacteraceae bacterium]